MDFSACVRMSCILIILFALRVRADATSGNMPATAGDVVSQPVAIVNAVGQSEFVTVQFSHSSSNSSSLDQSLTKRENSYSVTFSRQACTFNSDVTIFALPAPASDLHETLQAAISNAEKHSAAELQKNFISTASNLSVIINSLDEKLGKNSFNWQDFSSVVSIFLSDSTKRPDVNRTFVGIVKDPDKKLIAEVAIVPAYLIISDGKPSRLNMDPATIPPTTIPGKPTSSLPRRKKSDTTAPIKGTNFSMRFAMQRGNIPTVFLRTLIASAVDMVAMDPDDQRPYSAILTESFAYMFPSLAAAGNGRTVFSLRTEGDGRIRRGEMLAIISLIYRKVDFHASLARHVDSPRWRFSGQVVNQLNVTAANWYIGEPDGMLSCGSLVVGQTDGSDVHGCILG